MHAPTRDAAAAQPPSDTRRGGAAHWEAVYTARSADSVSWYRPHLERSLHWIGHLLGASPDAAWQGQVIDVGTGESTLADDLLARGLRDLTLLDLSATALAHLRARLEARHRHATARIQWIAGDVTRAALPAAKHDVWHDRAVLHFLTDPAQRAAYVAQAARCVRPGGGLVVAAFAEDGPTQCSALDVTRYSAEALTHLFSADFEPVATEREVHTAPSGAEQHFQYFIGRRR
jgi:SAM-dependent methyltransferase